MGTAPPAPHFFPNPVLAPPKIRDPFRVSSSVLQGEDEPIYFFHFISEESLPHTSEEDPLTSGRLWWGLPGVPICVLSPFALLVPTIQLPHAMYALRYIAIVLLLIALFGPGMAVLLDPTVAVLLGLVLVLIVALLADVEDTSEAGSVSMLCGTRRQ